MTTRNNRKMPMAQEQQRKCKARGAAAAAAVAGAAVAGAAISGTVVANNHIVIRKSKRKSSRKLFKK